MSRDLNEGQKAEYILDILDLVRLDFFYLFERLPVAVSRTGDLTQPVNLT